MAIDFPSNPTIGQEISSAGKSWQWTGETWIAVPGAATAFPVGVVLPFAGSTAPAGYLLCFGQAVNRVTYAALFATIGTAHGAGDGSTTFNVPDLRGRVVAGVDNMGGTAAGRLTNTGTGNPGINGATCGAAGGVDRHALATAQLAAHAHGVNDPTHNHGVSDPTHTHTVYDPTHAHTYQIFNISGGTTGPNNGTSARQLNNVATTYNASGTSNYGAATGVTVNYGATNITIQNAGSGEAHPNAQPTLVLNYIISTGGV